MTVRSESPRPRIRWMVGLLRHMGIMALGTWALCVQAAYRVPGPWLFFLPWIGVVLTVLDAVMFVNHVFRWVTAEDPLGQALERVQYWGSLGILIFSSWSLVLFSNGLHDDNVLPPRTSEILDLVNGDVDLDVGSLASVSWAKLRSWHDPSRVEYLQLRPDERRRLWIGEAVIVKFRGGTLGIPWVWGIERNEEKYMRDIVAAVPTAVGAWHRLMDYLLRQQRWRDAAHTAREYLRLYPDDYGQAARVADSLNVAGQNREAQSLLEPVAERHRDYWVYRTLAVAIGFQGESEKVVRLLDETIAMAPRDPDPYYFAGRIYERWGWTDKAIAMYEKLLVVSPGMPEAKQRVETLRKVKAEAERTRTK